MPRSAVPTPPTLKLEPVIDRPCVLSGVWSRLGVHLFHGKVSSDDFDVMEQIGDRWFAKNPGKLVELVVVFPSSARMSTAERIRMSRLIKRRERDRVASATVILAEGLAGATHRSILTGLIMLAPPPHPAKVFGTTKQAVAWLAPQVQSLCGDGAAPDALLSAVDDLCARFRARLV